jgi:hypothetical protein
MKLFEICGRCQLTLISLIRARAMSLKLFKEIRPLIYAVVEYYLNHS